MNQYPNLMKKRTFNSNTSPHSPKNIRYNKYSQIWIIEMKFHLQKILKRNTLKTESSINYINKNSKKILKIYMVNKINKNC